MIKPLIYIRLSGAGMTLALVFILSACTATPPEPTKLALTPVAFSDLPGWNADTISKAVPALQKSCNIFVHKPPEATLGIAGHAQDWRTACTTLAQLSPHDDIAARAFFEKYFQPFAASDADGATGLFTGYYEAELHGAWQADAQYQTPLYAHPQDLISVDLGLFKSQLKGQHIEGKVIDRKLQPYDDRAAIEKKSLNGRADVLLWVDDPVDAFFLAVQGSGRVAMPNGESIHVGYDAPNGRPYVAIGRVLADSGDIPKPVTMQKIRNWLKAHPDRAQSVMDSNPSYVFFRIIKNAAADDGPMGAETVSLTPRRSLAVDPAFVPLGVPLWLDTTDGKGATLQWLMVAQDTGGAIKGPIRGDVFWGFGAEAEAQAGPMQSTGRYYLLLPKTKN